MKRLYKIGAIVTTLCVVCIAIFVLTKKSAKIETAAPEKATVSSIDADTQQKM
ncbi:hypothetical protein P4530_02555 [Bacillus thuringiensis]|nr:hypothetical protein [Bacillus thuringiensis]